MNNPFQADGVPRAPVAELVRVPAGWRWLLPLVAAILCSSAVPAPAQGLRPPGALFRDPQFLRAFVGSYGILSEVEPKVSSEESQQLVKLGELFGAGRFAEAETELIRFIKEVEAPSDPEKQPGEISPAMVFVLGNLYFQADRFNDAERAFKEAIRRYPRFRRAHANLAYLYISKNRYDDALPHLQRAVELGESSDRIFGVLGYCQLLKKNPVAAEIAYRQAYLLNPQGKDWKMGLAQTLVQQDKMAEAASLLGTLIEENPEDRQLWLQQTNALLALERKDEAAVNLEVLRLKGLAEEADLSLLGNLHMDRGQPQLALFAYLAALDKADRLDVQRALKSARILNDYGYPEKAEEFISKVRTKAGDALAKPDQIALRLVDLRVAQGSGHEERVAALLEELLALDPASGEVLLENARHLDRLAKEEPDEARRTKLLADARTNFLLAAGHEATAYQASLGYGQLLVRERRFGEALAQLEKALRLKKSDSLDQYVARVRRAAEREQSRQELEDKQRAENEAAPKEKPPAGPK